MDNLENTSQHGELGYQISNASHNIGIDINSNNINGSHYSVESLSHYIFNLKLSIDSYALETVQLENSSKLIKNI